MKIFEKDEDDIMDVFAPSFFKDTENPLEKEAFDFAGWGKRSGNFPNITDKMLMEQFPKYFNNYFE